MSRRHLSSLKRGMSALTVLSMTGRTTAAALAKRINVPRTTAHRILDTLVFEGYVLYNPNNHCFQLGPKVRELAQGLDRDELISEVARPILTELCRELLLAVGLITPADHHLVLQVAMDDEAPLSIIHMAEGFYFPVTFGAHGRLFLAHCAEGVRNKLIAEAQSSGPAYLTSHAPPTLAELEHTRRVGYAVSARPGAKEGVLAVPVYFKGDYVASVHIRFTNFDGADKHAVERYLPRLKQAAHDVEAGLVQMVDKSFDGVGLPLPIAHSDECGA